ncbi:MAG: (2Fe-2S)-binding protein [Planctomycetaceae bacterium]|jgi:NADH-quinone oxidoreductase subunit G|nr:(2Fe-2S)-binding protein [Planctomycetaceae bacterium]
MYITFDGKRFEVYHGETVLTVARREGIDIPALCFSGEAAVHPPTSCLVCLVKVAGRFVPACATSVADGMSVESETDEVHQMRRSALELLLSDHISTCQTCGEGRKKCKLLRYMSKYKADRNKWNSGQKIEDDSHFPSSAKCIKCGICVAVSPALTFIGRGNNLRVERIDNGQTAIDNERLSRACPTAAIVSEERYHFRQSESGQNFADAKGGGTP